jgi:hypothetical protein
MTHLEEIAERARLGITVQITEYRSDWDRAWLLTNTKNALDFITTVKLHDWKQVPIGCLNMIEAILRGESDGRESGLKPRTESDECKTTE